MLINYWGFSDVYSASFGVWQSFSIVNFSSCRGFRRLLQLFMLVSNLFIVQVQCLLCFWLQFRGFRWVCCMLVPFTSIVSCLNHLFGWNLQIRYLRPFGVLFLFLDDLRPALRSFRGAPADSGGLHFPRAL